jgi:hypothetical protein
VGGREIAEPALAPRRQRYGAERQMLFAKVVLHGALRICGFRAIVNARIGRR